MGRVSIGVSITHAKSNNPGQRNLSLNNLDQALIHILDEKITLVEKN